MKGFIAAIALRYVVCTLQGTLLLSNVDIQLLLSVHSLLIGTYMQALYTRLITLAAYNGKRAVTAWRPSVRLSLCPVGILTATHTRGQHATRPAYIPARQ